MNFCSCKYGKTLPSGWKLYTGEDFVKMAKDRPKRPELKYKIEKSNFVILAKDKKGKWFEKYYIKKLGCHSLYRQYDWVLHMERKWWIDGYIFAKEFSKAIKQWDY